MPDSRFYETLAPASVSELASLTGAELADAASGSRIITATAPLLRAAADAISFLLDRKHIADMQATAAGACFIAPANAETAPKGMAVLLTREPQAAYAKAAGRLHRPLRHKAGGPPVHPTAELEDGVILGHGVVVGPGARIGAGTEIGSCSVIGPGVCIGRDCVIGSNAVIGFALIGDRVRILSGAVIGEAGFGIAGSQGGALDIPQLGRVILQDGVTVGSCSCIDRGAWDDTVIGENTKIDNLVQIAHNCQIGRSCVIAGLVGLAGSVTVGDGAMFGGGAGVADHINIGPGARIAAASGVMRDIPAGETWCGAPARPIRTFMRETAWLTRSAAGKSETAKDKVG
ncbi:UDP-3-O-(3-hydroxymyristoyl)glucosamine N-acyltransferase [Caulobacter sp. S45]|jgi:UDP-3-O-[3-hydroxymyristoyl] glucosamine N-acyltransferase|uniref:UDP-3-O-(3-hydroxymyristoyl)glucosamine N-acyltransferase n=1 Tax=Caulobacter sp. S45 TaxID=1641861 RepID=UPI00131B4680|nr:UDP-3-O-(3-hydroxymyristoyl)glucosamine N-acyltransferase [Caulobacter sp. S45]